MITQSGSLTNSALSSKNFYNSAISHSLSDIFKSILIFDNAGKTGL